MSDAERQEPSYKVSEQGGNEADVTVGEETGGQAQSATEAVEGEATVELEAQGNSAVSAMTAGKEEGEGVVETAPRSQVGQGDTPGADLRDGRSENEGKKEDTEHGGEEIEPDVTNIDPDPADQLATEGEIRDSQAVPEPETEDVNHLDSVSNVKANVNKEVKVLANETARTDERTSSYPPPQPFPSQQMGAPPSTPKLKKMKKGIFVSYSPDARFLERRFVVELVRQLKENNLAEDIWFDKDEKNTDSPCWFSLRMEAVERCRAAILVLSESYFTCPVSVYESKALLERQKADGYAVRLFPVLFTPVDNIEIPKQYMALMKNCADLTGAHSRKSSAEKTSVVIGAIMEELEKFATMNSPPSPFTPPDTEFTGEYKRKKICQWSANDLQEWLFKLGIKEFYRQSLAENMVDGFLLMSLTDHDMVQYLGIDSRAVRKKIMQQILQTLDKEHKQTDNWHLRARAQRAKPDVVYLIYDPADVRLAQNIKADLKKKSLQVIHHDSVKLGRSKEEFLQINGPAISTATNVVVLMTDAAVGSPFVFHEVLFSDWLGKKLVTAMFKNMWDKLRVSLKAVLGECPAVDFETKMYAESLDVLEHHIKPLRRVPGVVLEQTYLNKMADGLKPLELLACAKNGLSGVYLAEDEPKVFLSYQWDIQSKVDEIKACLERHGFPCWADINISQQRGQSSRSTRSSVVTFSHAQDSASETLAGQIQRNMKVAQVVLCGITPKYLQSDNCIKDLTLAETFNKPVVPLLMRFTPLESAPNFVRRILLKYSYVDLSNERLYKQNLQCVVDKVKKIIGNPS